MKNSVVKNSVVKNLVGETISRWKFSIVKSAVGEKYGGEMRHAVAERCQAQDQLV